MALRQMGIARMGNYRPKHDAVNRGGKTGRPKLLHNGTGHGLTGGGGLNAKGTGGGIKVNKAMKPMQRQLRKSKYAANKFNAMKINEREKNAVKRNEAKTKTQGGPVMNPHPTGSFMYGQGQWGTINASGKVDWTSQKPMQGKPIIGFNQALPWLQRTPAHTKIAAHHLKNRRPTNAQYWDPIYFRNKSQLKLQKEADLANLGHERSQLQHDFDYAGKDLMSDFDGSRNEMSATAGASEMAGSGMASAVLGKLAQDLLEAQTKNREQFSLASTGIDSQLQQSQNAFNVGLSGEESMARERWQSTHTGQKLPTSNKGKTYKQGGTTYRQDKQGIPMTWSPPKKKKTKGKK